MFTFSSIITGLEPKLVVDAIYYVSRYIKQADHLTDFEKDIFADDQRSEATEAVKSLTLEIIAAIEAAEGKPASDFDDPTLIRVMNDLADAEAEFTVELSEDQLREVESVIRSMQPPPVSNTD